LSRYFWDTLYVRNIGCTEKKGALLNQRGFLGLKKGFVHEAKLNNNFVHSTKPEKGFDFSNKMVWYGTLFFSVSRFDIQLTHEAIDFIIQDFIKSPGRAKSHNIALFFRNW
jgi:hypothetical protein